MDQASPHSQKIPKRMSGMRLDRALAELLPEFTRSQLQKMVRRGQLKLDGRKVLRSNSFLRGGEELSLATQGPGPLSTAKLELIYLHVEEEFAVVSKPPGMLTHPNERQAGGSVAELLVERFGELPSADDSYRPGIVHRLDRETSGIMVVALTQRALDQLRMQFRERVVEKVYLALVHGVPREEHFSVDAPLDTVRGQRDLQGITPGGREAHTEFSVLRSWSKHALVQCRPSTGRRHQLRVHLWSRGHPIVGDKLYRTKDKEQRARGLAHQALHAERLLFQHPIRAHELCFEAPIFSEFEEFMGRL